MEPQAVIGADGVRSVIRQAVIGDGPPRRSGYVYFRALLPAGKAPAGVSREDVTVWLLAGVHAVPAVRRTAAATGTGAIVWVATVSGGMLLRNLVFGRGTAAAFVVVATVFLGITMLGWRAARDWRAA
jgi:2-polyprenyl-6-methoxyphenol hydroxylase-like FAD-dependent oxidoreductase